MGVGVTAIAVLLWTDPAATVVVPKEALGDAAAFASFRAYVSARIGGGADLQRAPGDRVR